MTADGHAIDGHRRWAEEVDQIGLEDIDMSGDGWVGQRHPRVGRLGQADRRQGDNLGFAHIIDGDVRRQHQHLAAGLLQIANGEVGCFDHAVDLGQKGLG